MKYILNILFFVSIAISATAQSSDSKITFDARIGWLNGDNLQFASNLKGGYIESYRIHQFPVSVGVQGSYLFYDYLNVGVEVNYIESGYSSTYKEYSWETGSNIDVLYVDDYKRQKMRTVLKCGISKPTKNERIESEIGVCLGFRFVKDHYSTTNPNKSRDEFIRPYFEEYEKVTAPFTAGFYVGQRVFFNDHIGLNYEFKLGGGSILNMGITYRL